VVFKKEVAPMAITFPKASQEQFIRIAGDWTHFKLLQQGFAQAAKVRLSYYDGFIEIFMPSRDHELFAELIGHLIVIFLSRQGIFFVPTGSMDQELLGQAATQADKSYCIGKMKPIPDLSIEVVFTSGGVDKLPRYQALGVPEVWFWQDGTLALYGLGDKGYQEIDQSNLEGLKDLDLGLLNRCIMLGETDAGEAMRTFMQEI
jgi:Uma2 family endonuclease